MREIEAGVGLEGSASETLFSLGSVGSVGCVGCVGSVGSLVVGSVEVQLNSTVATSTVLDVLLIV